MVVTLTGVLHAELKLLEEELVLVFVDVDAPQVDQLEDAVVQLFLGQVVLQLRWVVLVLDCVGALLALILRVVVEVLLDFDSELI